MLFGIDPMLLLIIYTSLGTLVGTIMSSLR
jgi:hypothetical protein